MGDKTKNHKTLISILIPIMNEVESLKQTVDIILSDCSDEQIELIFILSPKSTADASRNASILAEEKYHLTSVITQKYPGLGGAYAHGIEEAHGNHIIMMASDLETDPSLVKTLIRESNQNPHHIITTTRWKGENSGFTSYGNVKKLFNLVFQKWVSYLYEVDLSDYTFGFRLYPSEAIKGIKWNQTNFAFLLESILVPIVRGYRVIEVPHFWFPRQEAKSSNQKSFYIDYFKTALKVRKLNQ